MTNKRTREGREPRSLVAMCEPPLRCCGLKPIHHRRLLLQRRERERDARERKRKGESEVKGVLRPVYGRVSSGMPIDVDLTGPGKPVGTIGLLSVPAQALKLLEAPCSPPLHLDSSKLAPPRARHHYRGGAVTR